MDFFLTSADIDTGKGIVETLFVLFEGSPVGRGSCVVGSGLKGEKMGMIVEGLMRREGGGLECTGLSFDLEDRLVVLKKGYNSETVFFARLEAVFALCPFSELETRSFWPSFILFIHDEQLPTLPSPKYPFLRHSYEYDMATFLNDFLSLLKSAMARLHHGHLALMELDCSESPFVLSFFSDYLPFGQLVDKETFPCFSKLLGSSYYFLSYDNVCESESGWGKVKGTKEGSCYVQYIIVEKTKPTKKNGGGKRNNRKECLKFDVHLAVKNNQGQWQVILGNSRGKK